MKPLRPFWLIFSHELQNILLLLLTEFEDLSFLGFWVLDVRVLKRARDYHVTDKPKINGSLHIVLPPPMIRLAPKPLAEKHLFCP